MLGDPSRLQAKASLYVVQAGTVIPAALITGIRSDLPGQITAHWGHFDVPLRCNHIDAGAPLVVHD
jgi:hypothetical protein